MKFQAIFTTIQKVFLYLILVLVGLYAGMLFFHELCPIETKLNATEFAKYWKIADGDFMHDRMGIFGPILLGLFILTILFYVREWKSLFFLTLGLSFLLFFSDVVLFNIEQAPINDFIRSLDLSNLTSLDIAKIEQMQPKSISNFHSRFLLAILSFLSLALTPFLRRKLDNQRNKTT